MTLDSSSQLLQQIHRIDRAGRHQDKWTSLRPDPAREIARRVHQHSLQPTVCNCPAVSTTRTALNPLASWVCVCRVSTWKNLDTNGDIPAWLDGSLFRNGPAYFNSWQTHW